MVFEKNISEIVGNVLKGYGYKDFTVNTEIVKKSSKSLQTSIFWLKRSYVMIGQLPSLQGHLFDEELVAKKIHAFESILFHLDDGKEFSSVRFGFSMTLPYERNIKDIEFELNQKFNNYYRNLHKFRTAFYKNISEDPVADIRSG